MNLGTHSIPVRFTRVVTNGRPSVVSTAAASHVMSSSLVSSAHTVREPRAMLISEGSTRRGRQSRGEMYDWTCEVTHWHSTSVRYDASSMSRASWRHISTVISPYPMLGLACRIASMSSSRHPSGADHSNRADVGAASSPLAYASSSSMPRDSQSSISAMRVSRCLRSTTERTSPALEMPQSWELNTALVVCATESHASHVCCSRISSMSTRAADLPRPPFRDAARTS